MGKALFVGAIIGAAALVVGQYLPGREHMPSAPVEAIAYIVGGAAVGAFAGGLVFRFRK